MLWAAWQKRMPAESGEGVVVFAIMRNGAYTDLVSGGNLTVSGGKVSVPAQDAMILMPNE